MNQYLDESRPPKEESCPCVLHRLEDWGVRDVLQGVDVKLDVGLLQLLPGLPGRPGQLGVMQHLVVTPEGAFLGFGGHPTLAWDR